MDEGYDESHNPFSDMSEDYVEKREQQIKQQRTEKMSARRKQINEVCSVAIVALQKQFNEICCRIMRDGKRIE